jgi:hypothetical protein
MSNPRALRTLLLVVAVSAVAFGETDAPSATLDRYLNGQGSRCTLGDQYMEIEVQASLPKLEKQGTMHGLKVISRSGQVAYRFLRFTGDKLVRSDVIGRFLSAEAQSRGHLASTGITRENYKFHYQRTADYKGATVFVFQLRPHKKREGLFKGELWLDAGTGTPLREAGELVKSPSIFIRRIRFVRDYPEHGSCGPPQRTSITVETRIAGEAEMVILQHPVSESWQPAEDSEAEIANSGR